MCHSLDVEECSKPKFKSVGLHLTVPQIDKVWVNYGTVPPIAVTWWKARAGGSVTPNVVLY